MKLKEIQMDLPFIYSDDISNEESVKLYQTTWKDKRREGVQYGYVEFQRTSGLDS